MCATNSIDHIFYEHWMAPGMHVSSIKRPEIEVKAIKRADRVIIHWNDPAPIHVAAKGVVIEERVEPTPAHSPRFRSERAGIVDDVAAQNAVSR